MFPIMACGAKKSEEFSVFGGSGGGVCREGGGQNKAPFLRGSQSQRKFMLTRALRTF